MDVKIFAETLEGTALEQINAMPSDSKIRIMPDAHAGAGCTIGTTMTIGKVVNPNYVGVDIGCGMLTIELKDTSVDFEMLDATIREKVPFGFNVHSFPVEKFDFSKLICIEHVDIERAKLSIGSLGGGNHFIEIDKSMNNSKLYLVIHSGSRKLGADICRYYSGLESFNIDDYLNDMSIAQKYASLNRNTIANLIGLNEINRMETIHNYIDFNRMILRKGAVSAEYGEKLLIPINMRDGSLLCVGKGNDDWNYSAPHGAGRLMSRGEAKKKLNMEEYTESMNGIYSTCIKESTIDESPMAYKPMEEIIRCITPTCDVIDILKPVYNFKA